MPWVAWRTLPMRWLEEHLTPTPQRVLMPKSCWHHIHGCFTLSPSATPKHRCSVRHKKAWTLHFSSPEGMTNVDDAVDKRKTLYSLDPEGFIGFNPIAARRRRSAQEHAPRARGGSFESGDAGGSADGSVFLTFFTRKKGKQPIHPTPPLKTF